MSGNEGTVQGKRRAGRARTIAVAAVCAVAVAACSVARGAGEPVSILGATGAPTAEAVPATPARMDTPSAASVSPAETAATPVATSSPIATAEPTTVPTPEPTVEQTPQPAPDATQTPTSVHAGPLPVVPDAPAARWTSIDWIAAGKAPSPKTGPNEWASFVAASWSGGYLGFWSVSSSTEFNGPARVYLTTSKDGLRWTAPAQIPSIDYNRVVGVAEANGILIALGEPEPGACGVPTVTGMWTSTDGVAWVPGNVKAAFGSATVLTITGGAAGFVAQGFAGEDAAIWTSGDATVWSRSRLPAGFTLGNGVSFAGGFVLSGTTKVSPNGGCGGLQFFLKPTIVWSADGATWTEEALPGVTSGVDAYMNVCRLSDRGLVAVASTSVDGGDSVTMAWTSTDGRTWTKRTERGWVEGRVVADSSHAVVIGSGKILFVDDQLRLTALGQRGDVPGDGEPILGRTGLLIAGYQGDVWLGVPSAS